jgi:hypothetical protein
MEPLLGMAGLAEAAETFGTLLVLATLGGFTLLMWLAFAKRSKTAFALGFCLWIGIGWLLQPWHALDGPQFPTDPDELNWIFIYRTLCVTWLVAAILSGVASKKCWKPFASKPKQTTIIPRLPALFDKKRARDILGSEQGVFPRYE